LTAFDPSLEEHRQAFPGRYAGLVNGTEEPFESFGFINFSVTGGGEPLELAPGKTATIEIPIPAEAAERAPENIDLWYYDAADGYWKLDGTATKFERENSPTIWGYFRRISSWLFRPSWNADRRYSVSTAVIGIRGSPILLPNVKVIADGVDYYGISSAFTGPDGRARLPVRPNSTVKIWGTKGGLKTNVITVTTGAAGEEVDVGELVFDTVPIAQIALTWGEYPRDLDSYLAGRIDNENIYICYYSMGSLVEEPFLHLDTDDRNSYGPEIITIVTGASPGTYRYSVHQYSSYGSLENSGALVSLIAGGEIRRFTPPSGQPEGTMVWRVFDITIDSEGNVTSVSPINDYVVGKRPLSENPDIYP
jgi:hypothetical protein